MYSRDVCYISCNKISSYNVQGHLIKMIMPSMRINVSLISVTNKSRRGVQLFRFIICKITKIYKSFLRLMRITFQK